MKYENYAEDEKPGDEDVANSSNDLCEKDIEKLGSEKDQTVK